MLRSMTTPNLALLPPRLKFCTKGTLQGIRLRRIAKQMGVTPSFPEFTPRRLTEPIYLVGSGSSVLDFELSPTSNSGIYVSVNDAIFLSNEFDFHSFELSNHKEWRPYVDRRISELLRDERLEVIANMSQIGKKFERPLFFSNEPEKVHLWASVTAEVVNFESQLEWYLSSKVSENMPGPDPNFSIGRLVIRAIKLGFRDIRLAGVDLLRPEHFWYDSIEHAWMRKIHEPHYQTNGREVHKTNSLANRWPALSFLEYVSNLTAQLGVQIRSNPSSPLVDYLGSYR